jgi:hypothetical protein
MLAADEEAALVGTFFVIRFVDALIEMGGIISCTTAQRRWSKEKFEINKQDLQSRANVNIDMTSYRVIQSGIDGQISEFCSAELLKWVTRDLGRFLTDRELDLQLKGNKTYFESALGRRREVNNADLESKRSSGGTYIYLVEFVP